MYEKKNIKERLKDEALKVMSSPKFMKLMQDERFMKFAMAAMGVPAKVSSFTETAGAEIARVMHMATAQEVKDLKRTIRKLEEQIASLGKNGAK